METTEIIKLWKELGIAVVKFDFDCGGDSMGNTDLSIIGNGGKKIKNQKIEDYFNDEVYNNVEFYVNSDGHYMGESGTVEIVLDENDEESFIYGKSSTSEWIETVRTSTWVELNPNQIDFIRDRIAGIGGRSDNETLFDYKRDMVLTDEDEKTIQTIGQEIYGQIETHDYAFDSDEEFDGDFSFTTDSEGSEMKIEGNMVLFYIEYSVRVLKED